MSFHRIGQNRRRKAPQRKQPAWDDTVQDLTVYRATPEEILLRKEAHKSKNHITVKLEKIRKDKLKNKLTGAETQQLALMKEILYDQKQLQEVLAKSDTMMAVVKDLFGDDPKRFMGFPNVTTAPQCDGDPNSSLVAPIPDIYTRTEKLSDSLMDQSALNDDLDTSDSEDEVDRPDPISYESKLNLQRFQEYLQEEESKAADAVPRSLMCDLSKNNSDKYAAVTLPAPGNQAIKKTTEELDGRNPPQMLQLLRNVINRNDQGQGQEGNLQDAKALAVLKALLAAKSLDSDFHTPTKRVPPLPSERTPPSAMNDTKKIRRSKKVLKSPKTSTESMNTTTSMSDMRKVLQELETEIATYEHQTGRRSQEEKHKTETFSGYTVALVTAVSRLTRYLKETDLRVRTEVTLREQLTEDVYQLRTIIDALATDIIVTQEEYGKLYSEYKHHRKSVEAELESLHNQLRELRHLVTGQKSRPVSQDNTEDYQQQKLPQQQQQNLKESANTAITNSNYHETSKTSTPLFDQHDTSIQSDLGPDSYCSLPSHIRPLGTAAAIMLSPPVRKTRVHSEPGTKIPQRQASLVDIAHLTDVETTHSEDPPRLTQALPVMNMVNVPRPIPLIQSNLSIPLTSSLTVSQNPGHTIVNGQAAKGKGGSIAGRTVQANDLADLVKFGDQTGRQLQQLQELVVEETLNDPAMQTLMQAQIAELNRLQEEARRRLVDLLDSQRQHQKQLQDQLTSDMILDPSVKNINGWQGSSQKNSVSPPISPISQRSEKHMVPEKMPQRGPGRGITVSMPVIDLNESEGSLPSPRSESVQSGK